MFIFYKAIVEGKMFLQLLQFIDAFWRKCQIFSVE